VVGTAFTVTTLLVVQAEPSEHVMLAVPAATPVIVPELAPTVTIDVLDDDQEAPGKVNEAVLPTQKEGGTIMGGGATTTVTIIDAVQPLAAVYRIVATPGVIPVIMPEPVIVAMPGVLLLHVPPTKPGTVSTPEVPSHTAVGPLITGDGNGEPITTLPVMVAVHPVNALVATIA